MPIQKLKMSIKVIQIFKADDESDPNNNNYRPISLLSSFNRIFKKLMYTRTNSFIEKREFCVLRNTGLDRNIQPSMPY